MSSEGHHNREEASFNLYGDDAEFAKFVGEHDLLFDELLVGNYEYGDGNVEGKVQAEQPGQDLSVCSATKSSQRHLTCGHCGYFSSNKIDFQRHLSRHSVQRASQRVKEIRIHKDLGEYKCAECDFTTTTMKCLTQHVAVHKRIVIKMNLDLNTYKCKQCKFTTRHWKDFKLHIPKHDALNVYKCDLCDFVTKWRQNLKPHVDTHDTAVKYKCDRCAYTTKLKRYLTQHYQQHDSLKRYKCRLCRFSTNWSKHLKQHVEVHNSSKAYQCDECGFTTNSRRNLIIHFKKYGTRHTK
ncbi:zinc finger protein 525-like [Photinus pyralis]|nr:zinc finger protein 525-like [Photinus pyralis]